MSKVAWIGLGVMGYPMAGHIQMRGHELVVYNRTAAKGDAWCRDFAGSTAPTPREAAAGAEFIFSCVGNDEDLRAVTIGEDGAFHSMSHDAVFIDNTTASAEVARELYAAAREQNIHFLDAPVSGGQSGAEAGTLTVMVGGDAEPYRRAEPVMQCFAQAVKLMGAAGAGQLTKMVNQICITGLIQALAEGLHFAGKAGLDIPSVMEVINKGAARSWQMENRWQSMIAGEFDYGFAVEWMRKDLSICLDEARSNGAQLPVTALVDQFYAELIKMGGRRWDTSSLVARLNRPE